jgi:D-glycero-alpha-D-manno-heptose 1-phosphate guanylyltransferase
VAGRPFLEWVLRYLQHEGVARVYLSTGHLAEQVHAFAAASPVEGIDIRCVAELEPLGTAGGFVHALGALPSAGDALVCNGDSLVLAPLAPLFTAALDADAAVLGVRVEDASRYGTLKINRDRLLGFEEKHPGAALVNAGVYFFHSAMLARFPRKTPLSFEYDVFPALLASSARIAVVPCEAPFLDIGTEESLTRADCFIRENMSWFK